MFFSSEKSTLTYPGALRLFRPVLPNRPGANTKAQGLNHALGVLTCKGAAQVGFPGTCPPTNGSPTRSGRSEAPEGSVPLCGTAFPSVNGCPPDTAKMPLTCQLPRIVEGKPRASNL